MAPISSLSARVHTGAYIATAPLLSSTLQSDLAALSRQLYLLLEHAFPKSRLLWHPSLNTPTLPLPSPPLPSSSSSNPLPGKHSQMPVLFTPVSWSVCGGAGKPPAGILRAGGEWPLQSRVCGGTYYKKSPDTKSFPPGVLYVGGRGRGGGRGGGMRGRGHGGGLPRPVSGLNTPCKPPESLTIYINGYISQGVLSYPLVMNGPD